MRIIEVKMCYGCPEKICIDNTRVNFWCPVSKRVFSLEDIPENNVPEWCELDDLEEYQRGDEHDR